MVLVNVDCGDVGYCGIRGMSTLVMRVGSRIPQGVMDMYIGLGPPFPMFNSKPTVACSQVIVKR